MMSEQCPKTIPGVNYVVKTWALVMMLKALPSWLKKILEHFVVKKISTKSAVFYQLFFGEV